MEGGRGRGRLGEDKGGGEERWRGRQRVDGGGRGGGLVLGFPI